MHLNFVSDLSMNIYDDLPEAKTGFQMSFTSDPNELKSTETAPKIINQAIQNMNAPWPEKNHKNLQISDRAHTADFTNDSFDDFTNNDDGPGNWEDEKDDFMPEIEEIDDDLVADVSRVDSKKRSGKRLRSKKCCKCDQKFRPEEWNHKMCSNCAPGRPITELEKIDGNNTKNCQICKLLFMPERTDHKLCSDCSRQKFYYRNGADGENYQVPNPWQNNNSQNVQHQPQNIQNDTNSHPKVDAWGDKIEPDFSQFQPPEVLQSFDNGVRFIGGTKMKICKYSAFIIRLHLMTKSTQ